MAEGPLLVAHTGLPLFLVRQLSFKYRHMDAEHRPELAVAAVDELLLLAGHRWFCRGDSVPAFHAFRRRHRRPHEQAKSADYDSVRHGAARVRDGRTRLYKDHHHPSGSRAVVPERD